MMQSEDMGEINPDNTTFRDVYIGCYCVIGCYQETNKIHGYT
jgi:hypothetical protein